MTINPLGNLTVEAFLRDYWQKQPLLIRGAFPGFTAPLTPEDLALLACEEDAQARLILEQGGAYPWELRYGPFEPDDFEALPPSHWTLLVQEVDRHRPAVAALLDAFRFLPNWRLDDVMVSYAPQDGGVGAHIDNYDVFLLQGLGHRRWQINTTPVEEETLIPDLDVSILEHFEADAEWILAPGDMLYLPPRIAHYGVAVDDCMTYSIGLRAPSHEDLLAGFLGDALDHLDPLLRYADPDLTQHHPGEITADVRARIRAVLRKTVSDDDLLDDWFGRFITEPKRDHYPALPATPYTPATLRAALTRGAVLRPHAVADFAYRTGAGGTATLFICGEAYPLDAELAFAAPLLTGAAPLSAQAVAPPLENRPFLTLLLQLVNEGLLRFET